MEQWSNGVMEQWSKGQGARGKEHIEAQRRSRSLRSRKAGGQRAKNALEFAYAKKALNITTEESA